MNSSTNCNVCAASICLQIQRNVSRHQTTHNLKTHFIHWLTILYSQREEQTAFDSFLTKFGAGKQSGVMHIIASIQAARKRDSQSVSQCTCWSWEGWRLPCGQSQCHGQEGKWRGACTHISSSGTHPRSCHLPEQTHTFSSLTLPWVL